MFLKNKNIIFKIRRSKVTDYAALRSWLSNKFESRRTEKPILGNDYPITFANSLDISCKLFGVE